MMFAILVLRIFACMSIRAIGLCFSFVVVSFPGFGIRVRPASQNEFSFPSFSIFGDRLRRIGMKSSLRVWQNLPVKLSYPGYCLLELCHYRLHFLTDTGYPSVQFSISSCFDVGRLIFSRNLIISSRLAICWHVFFHNIPL